MTSPTGPDVIGRSGGAGSGAAAQPSASSAAQPSASSAAQASASSGAQPSADIDRAYDTGPVWMRITPPLVTLAVMLWDIARPSYWRDEAATLAAVHRPFGDMIRMLGNVDAVHGAYYMIIWVVARLAGTGELAMRLPSAIATVLAAAAITALGSRLISPGAGFAAGMLFAVIPQVSYHGQEARSYAMVMAMAATASYLLVRTLDADPGRRRRWLVGYAASLTALGVLNIFALLLIPAHGVTVWLRCRRGNSDQSMRKLALGWLAVSALATVLVSPLLVLGWLQRGQISWLKVNGDGSLTSLERLIGSLSMVIAVAVVVAAGILISARAGRERLRARWPRMLPALCVPWLILPSAILLGASTITPMYTFRYVLFCIPAAALIGGAGLAALGRILGTVAMVVIVVLAFHAQVIVRRPDGHGDNIRAADQIVATYMARGDAVLYTNVNAESFGAAYPYGLVKLRNIALRQAAIPSATLAGTDVSAAAIRQRLAHISRLWVVDINHLTPAPVLKGLHLRRVRTWRRGDVWLLLYVPRGVGVDS